MASLPPAIFIMGPTAAGKTELAMALLQQFDCELISVDSALIYKGMDIGTAKPSKQELQQAPHRLIDILDPSEAYSAANFRIDALAAMTDISAAGKIPLLVGGTMLYFRALEHGLADLPASSEQVRQRLDAEIEQQGLAAMHRRLQQLDPNSAARIHPNDLQRIQRALEVFEISGRTMTELHAEAAKDKLQYKVSKIIVAPEQRSVLHQRIEKRFKLMLDKGFVDEVVGLRQRGDLSLSLPSMRAVGYRQVWEYLDGLYDYDEMRQKGIVATRQFAKRQLTWLRSEQEVAWLKGESPDLLEQALKYITASLNI